MTDNENTAPSNPVNADKPFNFYFEMAIKTKGIVSSAIEDVEQLKATMVADFNNLYGEGNTDILILRTADADEVEKMEAEAMQGFDELVAEIESEDAVIN